MRTTCYKRIIKIFLNTNWKSTKMGGKKDQEHNIGNYKTDGQVVT